MPESEFIGTTYGCPTCEVWTHMVKLGENEIYLRFEHAEACETKTIMVTCSDEAEERS